MKPFWLVVSIVVTAVALLGGCGGHNGQVPADGGGGVIAAFVGVAVCGTCHATIHAAYGSYNGVPFIPGTIDPSHVYANFVGSAHGQDMRSKGPGDRNCIDLVGSNATGGCLPCHTTGWQEAGGFTSSAETPHLEGIGCEECHGRGDGHAGAPSSDNIAKTPDPSTTCFDCHVPRYKVLRAGPTPPISDDSPELLNTAPGSVRAHYRQAPFQLGEGAYNRPTLASPHSLIENTCVTCHLNSGSGSTHGTTALAVDYIGCAACHGSPAAAQALWEEFEEEMEELLIELGGEDPSNPGQPASKPDGGLLGAYAAANGIDLATNSDPDNPVVQRYKAARWNWYLAEGCGPIHNPPLARQVLQDALDLIE